MSEATLTSLPVSRVEPVDEEFHGQHVPDPYRWLEDGGSDEVRAWVRAQNGYTEATLSCAPGREEIKKRLTELLQTDTIGVPVVRNGRYFFQRRQGTQNQPVLYVREGVDGKDRALVNPNALSEGGTVALDWSFPSRDGRLLAYGLSENGSELSTLRVLDVESGRDLSEQIDRTRYTSLAWLPDGLAFYYTRLPAPDTAPEDELTYHRRVFLHRLGTDPESDELIWSERRDMREQPSVWLTPDGRWLLLTVSLGWDRSDVYVRDLSDSTAGWITIVEDEHALFWGEIDRETLYLTTNLDAPRYRVVSVPLARPLRDRWRDVVPERQDAVLVESTIVGGRLALGYLVNATSRLEMHELDGALISEIPLPGVGSTSVLSGEHDGSELFFDFTSFTTPVVIFRLNLQTDALTEWASVSSPLDPEGLNVEQVWYDSTDGARVSMFLVHRRGLVRDGNNPVLLTGYGGFNINRVPEYRGSITFWLEQGGVYALPNLRGGGEYGEEWHASGMLARKQHTFDDFIGAAQYLVDAGYTTPERLAILGGSNGGLLVGAAITQRPDLFRAAVCQVPLLDMLRYHRFLIARLWIAEYGSAEDPEQYGWLKAYSPYHNTADGVHYPAVLFTTAESDSRVDPSHARKMTALLQARQAAPPDECPILLRVETQAGHGQGKPVAKQIDEATDLWSFICGQLGVDVGNRQ
jgi:prolyl oligopeptidase